MSTVIATAVLNLLDKNKDSKKVAKAVAAHLTAERRTGELNSILRKLEELKYQRDGSLEVTATVARPLSAAAKEEIKQIFKAEQVIIHEEIDETILGGVKVRALDKAADFSVQARLQRLRQGGNDIDRRQRLRRGT